MKNYLCVQNGAVPIHKPMNRCLRKTFTSPYKPNKSSIDNSIVKSFIIKEIQPNKREKDPFQEHEDNLIFMNQCLRKKTFDQKKFSKKNLLNKTISNIQSIQSKRSGNIRMRRKSQSKTISPHSKNYFQPQKWYSSDSQKKTKIQQNKLRNIIVNSNLSPQIKFVTDEHIIKQKKYSFTKQNNLFVEGIQSPTLKIKQIVDFEAGKKKYISFYHRRFLGSSKKNVRVIYNYELERKSTIENQEQRQQGKQYTYIFDDLIKKNNKEKTSSLHSSMADADFENQSIDSECFLKTINIQ